MCGISAVLGGEDVRARLRLLHSVIPHRGPDGEGLAWPKGAPVGLAVRRLKVKDLTDQAAQPMASPDGRIWLAFNGEIDNFRELRAELSARGRAFRSQGDTEVLLAAYEAWGTDAFARLDGMWAVALADLPRRCLVLSRDRFGIKPLYYTVHKGTFHLASEVKAFRELGVPLAWDRDALYDVHFVSHPPDRTLFAGIYQVPPGCYLLTDGEHVRVIPYWDWDYPLAAETKTGDEREWVERIRTRFEEAVRLRLRADVPVACYLSGGIDSCAVLGVASRLSSRPLRAFTLSFDHADYDEAAIAEEQARLSGAEFCRVDIRSEELADHFSNAIYHAERPFVNAHAIAKYRLSRAVRESGIKVVLTGEGSDEIFAGYPHFRRDLVLYASNGADPAEKQRLLSELEAANRVSAGTLLPQGSTALDSVRRVLGFVPSNLESFAQIGAGLLGFVDERFVSAYSGRDTFRVLLSCLDVEGQLSGRNPVNQALYVWGKTMLPNYILSNLGDRMEMAHSVEGRLPFLDHHLATEATRMPVSMKIKGMTEKYVLREAARPVLTDTVYHRQKHPFMSPPATVQRDGRLYTLLQDTLRSSVLDGPGIYDRAKVQPMLDALPALDAASRGRVDALLMWMTSLCLMHQRLGMQA